MYRNLLGIGAVFLAALLLIGITFSAQKELPADFRFVNGTEPKSLDPHVITGQPEGRIVDAIFEGLTYREPETLKPVPGVAASWDISPDKKTYTFHLRPEARWSDGVPVTAHDFAWAWRRLQEPAIGSEYAYILHVVSGAEIFNLYAGHVERLVGAAENGEPTADSVAGAVRALRASKPDGIEAVAWQKFLGTQHVNDVVKGSPDPVIKAAIHERTEVLSADRLQKIEQSLRAEAERRRGLHAHALEHFGIDEGVYAKDDHTLVVELVAPTPYFLELTAFYSAHPVPRHLIERLEREKEASGADMGREDWFLPENMVSNGPFRLEAWRVNDKIRLVKSDTYWNKDSIKLGIIDAFPIENYNTAMNVYLTGGAEWTTTYPTSIVDALKERADFHRNAGMVVYYYRFNTTRKPFNDRRVRKAVAMAINRQLIVDNILKLGQTPAFRLTPPGLGDYDPPPDGIRHDPEGARALLAEAGYPKGKGVPSLTLLFNTSETHKTIAEEVASQLRTELGLDVKALNQEWQMYQASTLALEYDIARAGWIGDYLDPNTFLDMWITNGGNNQTGWSNAMFDRLIAYAGDVETFVPDADELLPRFAEPDRARTLLAALAAADDAAARVDASAALRLHLFREAETILFHDEFPVMPIYFYVVSSLVSEKVRGWHPNPQDIHPLRGISMEGR
ncbi:MAG: peptide ABC transporter substrate-binding protein [Planctomycetota bacterium]|nr:peptide ABC transporter substrate-binding protein [Planctomycetota bacterium]